MRKQLLLPVAVLAILGSGMIARPVTADQPSLDTGRYQVVRDAEGNTLFMAAPPTVGQYWLGVECLPVMPALRSQLNLPDREGLLVARVATDSPAARAGVLRHDILMRVSKIRLTDVRDLIQAIESAKGGKLDVELIRNGKPLTVHATPVNRPEGLGQRVPAPPEAADWSTIQKWMEGMVGHDDGDKRPPMRFQLLGPGVLDVLTPRPLPPDVSIVISREGDKPAQITVKRGENKWELREKELDKLPADLRPYAEQMLGRTTISLPTAPKVFGMPAEIRKLQTPGAFEQQIQKRLDEMDRRIEKLLQAVNELHAGQARPPADQHPAEPNK